MNTKIIPLTAPQFPARPSNEAIRAAVVRAVQAAGVDGFQAFLNGYKDPAEVLKKAA